MKKRSAGILAWRRRPDGLEFFLVHPGGPFWKNKDDGAWSIPKGEIDPDEEPLSAAQREFEEETGLEIGGTFTPLTPVKIASGKVIEAWAIEHDLDASAIRSNTFESNGRRVQGSGRPFPKWIERRGFPGRSRFKRSRRGRCPCFCRSLADLTLRTISLLEGRTKKPFVLRRRRKKRIRSSWRREPQDTTRPSP